MKNIFLVALLFTAVNAAEIVTDAKEVAAAQDEGIHLVKVNEDEVSYEKLSALKMQERLIATAEQFKEFRTRI